MILKCFEDDLEKLCNDKNRDLLLKNYNRLEGEEGFVKKGCFYAVYGFFVPDDINSFKWYLLNYGGKGPLWFPEVFFEVIDSKISKYWMTFWMDEGIAITNEKGKLYTFPEFMDSEDFELNLIDRENKELQIFNEYARKIKDEALY